MTRKIPKHIAYIFFTFISGILFFTLLRLILLLTQTGHIKDIPGPERIPILLKSFFIGFRFDTVISGYILFIPLVALSFTAIVKIESKTVYRIVFGWILFLYCFAFFICLADIPYFNYYFSHLSSVIFTWTDDAGFILKMILHDFRFWWIFIPLIIVSVLFYLLCKRFYRKIFTGDNNTGSFFVNIAFSLLAIVVMFIGIRGRIEPKSPIKIGTAFFCNYSFANQLGLNPIFNLFYSWIESSRPGNKSIHLMDDGKAIQNVQRYLNIPTGTLSASSSRSPIARKIIPVGSPIKANVVLIIMASRI